MRETPNIIAAGHSGLGLCGRVSIAVRDLPAGRWRWHVPPHERNLVTAAGRHAAMDAINGTGMDLDYMAVGTDSTSPATGDTALGNEVFRATFTTEDDNDDSRIYRLTLGSADANGSTLTEAGLFDQAAGGTLFSRFTFAGIAKNQNTAVQINWTLNAVDASS